MSKVAYFSNYIQLHRLNSQNYNLILQRSVLKKLKDMQVWCCECHRIKGDSCYIKNYGVMLLYHLHFPSQNHNEWEDLPGCRLLTT